MDSNSEVQETNETSNISDALKGMFSFFTMLPINVGQKEMNAMNKNFFLIPIVGLFYAIIGVFIHWAAYEAGTSLMTASVLTVLLLHVINRFLHFDGLVDVGDGLTVAGEKDDHIRALKDTRIGAGGLGVGLLVTMLIIACYTHYTYADICLIFIAELLARNAQVCVAAFGTAGNGMAGDSVRNTDTGQILSSTIISLIVGIIGVFVVFEILNLYIEIGTLFLALIVATVVSILIGYLSSKVAEKNFGMVNGDVLGAVNEVSRALIALTVIVVVGLV